MKEVKEMALLNEKLYKEYGAIEYNMLPHENYHNIDRKTISWYSLTKDDRIIAERIRLLTDPGFPWFDISYFHIWVNGETCELRDFPVDQIPKKNWKGTLIEECKKQGIFIKDIIDSVSRMY